MAIQLFPLTSTQHCFSKYAATQQQKEMVQNEFGKLLSVVLEMFQLFCSPSDNLKISRIFYDSETEQNMEN